jgi:hypothetical protein
MHDWVADELEEEVVINVLIPNRPSFDNLKVMIPSVTPPNADFYAD